MSLQFVSITGDALSLHQLEAKAKAQRKPRAAAEKPEKFHKGFRVVGIPVGAMESAREAHERLVAMADKAGGREIKPWDAVAWLNKYKRKAVRSKPYEILSSAETCADLARRAGWTDVQVVALAKGQE